MAEAEVRCSQCGRSGIVVVYDVIGKDAKYEDRIPHTDDCPIGKKLRKSGFTSKQPRHLRKKRWRVQERRAAKKLGIRETPASGALGEDGDARSFHGMRLECKQTESGRYILSQDVWSKLVSGAQRADEIPVLQVELHGNKGICRFYIFPKGSYDVSSREIKQKSARKSLHLMRADLVRTPFHVTTLDPTPVVVTEHQLVEAINATE